MAALEKIVALTREEKSARGIIRVPADLWEAGRQEALAHPWTIAHGGINWAHPDVDEPHYLVRGHPICVKM